MCRTRSVMSLLQRVPDNNPGGRESMLRCGSLVGFCYQPDVIVTSRSRARSAWEASTGIRRRGRALERLLEPVLQVCAVSTAHDEFGAVLQEHRVVAMAARLELRDPV